MNHSDNEESGDDSKGNDDDDDDDQFNRFVDANDIYNVLIQYPEMYNV